MAVIAGLFIAGSATAQTGQGPQAPEHYTLDGNNVDVVMGTFNFSVTDVAIGPEDGGLNFGRITAGEVHRSNLDGVITVEYPTEPTPGYTQWTYTVSIGGASTAYEITVNNSSPPTTATMTSDPDDGSTLYYDGVDTYTHIDAQGTVRLFSTDYADPSSSPISGSPLGLGGRVTQMTKPTGERWDWTYRSATVGTQTIHRTQSVTNTRGYQIKFEYDRNATPTTAPELVDFGLLSSARAINNAVDYCDPTADTCSSFSEAWPVATYARTASRGGRGWMSPMRSIRRRATPIWVAISVPF